MKTLALRPRVLSISTAAALLAGCSGSQPPIGAPGAVAQMLVRATHIDRRRSWMLPEAKTTKKLLYVSDWVTNDVFVYNFGSGKLVGTLTGFSQPYGQCVDAKGNVWITNFGEDSAVEYAHGGASPIATLTTDGPGIACSVDPTTGNLGVVNLTELLIFPHASGTPQVYTDPEPCYYMLAGGFDKDGNFYVEGDDSGTAQCGLPHGGSTMSQVDLHPVNIYIYDSAGVMWDGRHIVLADAAGQGYQTVLYRFVAQGSWDQLYEVSQIQLSDNCYGPDAVVSEPFIVGEKNTPLNRKQGTTVVGGNYSCYEYEGYGKFDYWPYDAGGLPKSTLKKSPAEAAGQSVSIAP
jgi:hypothetical protein